MTVPANLAELLGTLDGRASLAEEYLTVTPENLLAVATRLKDPAGPDYEYLDMITATDYPDFFEIVYRFVSLKKNEFITVKTLAGKDNPAVPSLVSLWQGADFQEREIYDLFGVVFTGRSDLKRIMLWEGFQGHPLRKDYRIDA